MPPMIGNGIVARENDKHPNLYLRMGQSVSFADRMFLQIVEGHDYSSAFSFEKKVAGAYARFLLETAFEQGNNPVEVGNDAALKLERDALELLKKAQKLRDEAKERLEKLDPEVAEYRKTELTSNPITAKNFTEWEMLDEAGKQGWRDRYLAVAELFKKKFGVESDVTPTEEWEPVTFDDLRLGDQVRCKVGAHEQAYSYRTLISKPSQTRWATGTYDISRTVPYAVLERKVK